MHQTPVVFCFDGKFATFAAVAIASLVTYTSVDLEIYCVADGLSEYHKLALTRAVHNSKSRLFFVTSAQFITEATYLRFHIPDIIPNNKALYLDSDLIVTCDIAPLLNVDLDDNWIAGCVDDYASKHTPIPHWLVAPYINAGVMLMNLEQLRKQNFMKECRTISSSIHKVAVFGDQCIINTFARNRKMLLNSNWNILVGVIQDLTKDVSSEILRSKVEGKGIIHFCGVIKPWMSVCDPWLADIWLNYKRLIFDENDQVIQY